jgi:hypothetical protein
MQMTVPSLRPFSVRKAPAAVRVLTREDVMWNRPIFRAPPLNVKPPTAPFFPSDLSEPVSAGR